MPKQQRKTKTQTANNEAVKRVIHPDLRHEIEKRAYEIWQSSGCSQGNDLAHWLQAENEVLGGPSKEHK